MKAKTIHNKLVLGRSEWCELHDLKIPAIRAKIDTGAKTSAIHAENIKPLKRNGQEYVAFDVYPLQANDKIVISCCKPIIDERYIMSSNGHKERRWVIETRLSLGGEQWPIELTLSNRDPLKFRLLLGREALSQRALVDPGIAYHQLKLSPLAAKKLYRKQR